MRWPYAGQRREPALLRFERLTGVARQGTSYLLVATAVLLLAACTANASTPATHAAGTPSAAAKATLAPTPSPTPSEIWRALEQRPLNLPSIAPGATCPKLTGHLVSSNFGYVLGDGPAYPFWAVSSALGTMQTSVLDPVQWYIDPSYTGPVLVRGRQLDGSGVLTFEGGLDQLGYQGAWRDAPALPALRLMGGPAYTHGSQWASFATHTNVPEDGCYAYQVDGTSFSYALTFLAEEIEY
jgi:hypothetical protein